MARVGRLGLIFATLGAAVACSPSRVYHCGADQDCVRGAEAGRCLERGCAFDDVGCASGLRWVEESPVSAGECVPTTIEIPDAMPDGVIGGGADGGGSSGNCLAARQISAGAQHACLVTTGDEVWCWGLDTDRQLGTAAPSPDGFTPVFAMGGVSQVAAGGRHTCALLLDGGVTCWGANDRAQLGRGTTGASSLPDPAQRVLTGVTALAAGADHACAVQGGTVYCWGENFEDQSDPDEIAWELEQPQSPGGTTTAAAQVAAGVIHSVGLEADGSVVTWGESGMPQLGRSMSASEYPGAVDARVYHGIAAGWAHTCAIPDVAGTVTCWGSDLGGNLGVYGDKYVPTDVSIAETPDQLGAGHFHTCAHAGTSLYCWGSNFSFQLGAANPGGATRQRVHSSISWTQVAAGGEFTCGIDSDARVRCWGTNTSGQLGRSGFGGIEPTPIALSCP